MTSFVIIDAAIGMILIFLLLSLVASAVREVIEGWCKSRAALLERGVLQLLGDQDLTAALYAHPQVGALYHGCYEEARKAGELPSYIPSSNFALALLDLAVRGRDVSNQKDAGATAPVLSVATVRQNIARIWSPKAQRAVLCALDLSGDDLTQVRAALERWFESSMERVSGWYKRQTARWLLVIGICIAAITNVDAIRVARSLYRDAAPREAAVALASAVARDQMASSPLGENVAVKQGALEQLGSLGLPIGWPDAAWSSQWFTRVFGWLVTALAISLGAPFWFGMLNRIMPMRSTVKPGERGLLSLSSTAVLAAEAKGFEAHEWAAGSPRQGVL